MNPSESIPPTEEQPIPDESGPRRSPPWLQDVDRAAAHLARLSLETDAQAALITRGSGLWAYAGELSHSALDELAGALAANLQGFDSGDMARFIRLKDTGREYMLYSTGLGEDLVLTLAFDAGTRFSEIRAQAFQLARALSTIPNGENFNDRLPQAFEPEEEPLLEDDGGIVIEDLPVQTEGAQEESLEAEQPGPSDGDEPEADLGLDKYLPTGNNASTESLFLDPISPAIHNLSFACVLIPRIPLHRLLGDLKEGLEGWLPQICLGYGWRLSDLAVHPDRLLWVINLPPDYSPAYMLETIRSLTSEQIFQRNPMLKDENRSGDFWAPGYMILASSRLPADEPVAKYIRRTRSWQGYR